MGSFIQLDVVLLSLRFLVGCFHLFIHIVSFSYSLFFFNCVSHLYPFILVSRC